MTARNRHRLLTIIVALIASNGLTLAGALLLALVLFR
jgi:hypothetical protein